VIKYLDFEKSIELIDIKIAELGSTDSEEITKKIANYNSEKKILFNRTYSNLKAWQKVQIARHPDRPHSIDYIKLIFDNFITLAGDKKYGEDEAIIAGIGKIENKSYMIIGNEKGNTMDTRIKHNFGMARPEGYRKTQRLMLLAEKLNLPIVTFVDTAGAFPGKDAEERGQSESIASSILTSLKVKTPIISIIIGEGGSGGAIALATADRVLMLEFSIYSVISPEGCSSILWRSSDYVKEAADSLKLTAQDCLKFGIIDEIIAEIKGGAHRFVKEQINNVKKIIIKKNLELEKISLDNLVKERNNKFLNITKYN
tara:strand:- start:532 stop:1473 length:942 start_codon:yes stop_codon:yes gene_type:complete